MEETMDDSVHRAVPATDEQLARLARAASGLGLPWAERLGDPAVAVAHGHVPDFPQWEVLTVAERGLAHPGFTSIALPRRGDTTGGVVLDGRRETWNRLVAGTDVDGPESARCLAERYLHFASGGRRVTVVETVGAIPWSHPRSDASRQILDVGKVAADGAVHPVEVLGDDDGWRVRLTMVDQDRLVAHDLGIDRGGAVLRDEVETLVTGLLVPVAG